MLRESVIFFLLIGFWLLISDHHTPLIISLGVASALLAFSLSKSMRIIGGGMHTFAFYLRLPAYSCWLLWQIIKSNLSVAKCILHPALPINPDFIKMRMTQKNDLGRLVHANSITLTPGTISTDIDEGAFNLEVHVLVRQPDTEKDLVEFDRRASTLERGKS